MAAVVLLVPAAITIFLGWQLKVQCTTHTWDGYQYRHSCYNDIYALYFFRDLQPDERTGEHPRRFPYLDSTAATRAAEKDIEYPVGTGLYMGAVAKTTTTPKGYFNASAVGLAIAGLVGVLATTLIARDRARVLYFALAPTVILYAFHNWDLLAVAITALAFVAYVKGRDLAAGVALGVGASTKLYPGFVLPIFVIARGRERDRSLDRPAGEGANAVARALGACANFLRPSRSMIGGAVASAVLVNLPVLLANPGGWWHPWRFQSRRFTNFETVWYMIYRHLSRAVSQSFWFDHDKYPRLLNLGTALLFLGGSALLVRAELKRDRFRVCNVALGVILIWLITAKVFSPQYMLWVLPFFALVRIPWHAYAGFVVTDAAVWAAISAYFLAASATPGGGSLQLTLLEVAVFARYAALGWMLWLSRGAPELMVGAVGDRAGPDVRAVAALASDA